MSLQNLFNDFIPGALISLERPPLKNGLLYIVLDGFYLAITQEIAKKLRLKKLLNEKKIQSLLLGNPNTGKSSLFNKLTGLNQKVGNFPGVTVEKKRGV